MGYTRALAAWSTSGTSTTCEPAEAVWKERKAGARPWFPRHADPPGQKQQPGPWQSFALALSIAKLPMRSQQGWNSLTYRASGWRSAHPGTVHVQPGRSCALHRTWNWQRGTSTTGRTVSGTSVEQVEPSGAGGIKLSAGGPGGSTRWAGWNPLNSDMPNSEGDSGSAAGRCRRARLGLSEDSQQPPPGDDFKKLA